jgi:hypothetical protein
MLIFSAKVWLPSFARSTERIQETITGYTTKDQQNPEDARKRVRLLGRGQPLPSVQV